jgi:hypothetical protein
VSLEELPIHSRALPVQVAIPPVRRNMLVEPLGLTILHKDGAGLSRDGPALNKAEGGAGGKVSLCPWGSARPYHSFQFFCLICCSRSLVTLLLCPFPLFVLTSFSHDGMATIVIFETTKRRLFEGDFPKECYKSILSQFHNPNTEDRTIALALPEAPPYLTPEPRPALDASSCGFASDQVGSSKLIGRVLRARRCILMGKGRRNT